MPALIINRIAYEDTCMVVWNLCLRFFRLRAKDRYDRRRHTEYAGYRQIFLRGDERKRDGCTTGRSGKNGERQIQIHQGSRQDDQDVHIPQQHRLHRMGEARSEHQNHRRSPLCAELAGGKRHSNPRTSRTEPLPGGYTGGKHTHPRFNGRVYETAPQDQSERFGRQTGICFDQADGEQHT